MPQMSPLMWLPLFAFSLLINYATLVSLPLFNPSPLPIESKSSFPVQAQMLWVW